MWRLFYNIVLLLLSPAILAVLLAKQRCRRGLLERLGWGRGLSSRPDRPDRPVIWIHAVSLGEVVAVTPLVKALSRRHPDCRLVVSTVTETGREVVEQRLPAWLTIATRHSISPGSSPALSNDCNLASIFLSRQNSGRISCGSCVAVGRRRSS